MPTSRRTFVATALVLSYITIALNGVAGTSALIADLYHAGYTVSSFARKVRDPLRTPPRVV
jgi:hypothetical protein